MQQVHPTGAVASVQHRKHPKPVVTARQSVPERVAETSQSEGSATSRCTVGVFGGRADKQSRPPAGRQGDWNSRTAVFAALVYTRKKARGLEIFSY